MKLETLLLFVATLIGLSLATPYYHRFKYAPHYRGFKFVRVQEERRPVSAIDQEYGNKVWVSICNAMFDVTDTIKPGTPCSVITTLTVTTILTKCPIVTRLSQEFLQQRLDHLQQICHAAILAKHLANIQWDSGMDYPCKFFTHPGFIPYLVQLCHGYMSNDKDIPKAMLKMICDEEKRGNLIQYLNETCSEGRLDMMPARNLLAESTSIPAEHTVICTALSNGDRSTAIHLLDGLCNRIDGGASPDVDRITETHWGLCTSETPEDRLKMLCLAIKKGYLECPSRDVLVLCHQYK